MKRGVRKLHDGSRGVGQAQPYPNYLWACGSWCRLIFIGIPDPDDSSERADLCRKSATSGAWEKLIFVGMADLYRDIVAKLKRPRVPPPDLGATGGLEGLSTRPTPDGASSTPASG